MWSIELRNSSLPQLRSAGPIELAAPGWVRAETQHVPHVEPVRKSPRYLPSCWGRPQAWPNPSPGPLGTGPGLGLA